MKAVNSSTRVEINRQNDERSPLPRPGFQGLYSGQRPKSLSEHPDLATEATRDRDMTRLPKLASHEGLEPPTCGFGDRCSAS